MVIVSLRKTLARQWPGTKQTAKRENRTDLYFHSPPPGLHFEIAVTGTVLEVLIMIRQFFEQARKETPNELLVRKKGGHTAHRI